jgi:hypothetical protein
VTSARPLSLAAAPDRPVGVGGGLPADEAVVAGDTRTGAEAGPEPSADGRPAYHAGDAAPVEPAEAADEAPAGTVASSGTSGTSGSGGRVRSVRGGAVVVGLPVAAAYVSSAPGGNGTRAGDRDRDGQGGGSA